MAALKEPHRPDIVRECNFLKNFTLYVLNIATSGNLGKTLKIQVKLILNFPRAYAITYTYQDSRTKFQETLSCVAAG